MPNNILTGRVIKAVGGRFWAKTEERIFVCSARGRIQKDCEIIVGDFVEIEIGEGDSGDDTCVISSVLPRKNSLIRPLAANVDQIIFVVAPRPEPDYLLIDKMIVRCCLDKLDIVLCLNKDDLVASDSVVEKLIDKLRREYARDVLAVVRTSAEHNDAHELVPFLKGKLSCFAGQSAVGKSSLINCLIPKLDLSVGGMSEKNQRGKHTTRHTELFESHGGLIADTPGFSKFSIDDVHHHELNYFYAEYVEIKKDCRFDSCTHTGEPDCAVQIAMNNGALSKERHARYKELFFELKNAKKRFY